MHCRFYSSALSIFVLFSLFLYRDIYLGTINVVKEKSTMEPLCRHCIKLGDVCVYFITLYIINHQL